MTLSEFRLSFVVIVSCSLVALLSSSPAALAQTAGAPSIAEQLANPPAGAQTTASGLVYVIDRPGTGTVKPTDTDLVKVSTLFWSADSKDGKAGSFGPPTRPMAMGQIVLPGLREGLSMMTAGAKMRMWLPEKLAFGGAAGRPKGPLMIEAVLLDVVPAPRVPEDVAKPGADAVKTKSGIYSKVLRPGTGTVHPKASSTVRVHYSGWTTDGQMFDSSVLKGAAATFPLDGVIKGWTEGVQLMVVGETRRFWIPGRLAYDDSDNPNTPKGTLVFDIELVAIEGQK